VNQYEAPKYRSTAFNCPHCGAYSEQTWSQVLFETEGDITEVEGLDIAICRRCEEHSLWSGKNLIYPFHCNAPLPNPDLPDDIKAVYEEARGISTLSPTGAAALLRLAIQKLCVHLGEKGQNINTDIAALVTKGLPTKVQQALDIVRVIGNNAVHPGQINVTDDPGTVGTLFELINLTTEVMISQPEHIEDTYSRLPESTRKAIDQRDENP